MLELKPCMSWALAVCVALSYPLAGSHASSARAQDADPVLTIVEPAPQSPLVGVVRMRAAVVPAVDVERVEFFVNGAPACAAPAPAPFECSWDAGKRRRGTYRSGGGPPCRRRARGAERSYARSPGGALLGGDGRGPGAGGGAGSARALRRWSDAGRLPSLRGWHSAGRVFLPSLEHGARSRAGRRFQREHDGGDGSAAVRGPAFHQGAAGARASGPHCVQRSDLRPGPSGTGPRRVDAGGRRPARAVRWHGTPRRDELRARPAR